MFFVYRFLKLKNKSMKQVVRTWYHKPHMVKDKDDKDVPINQGQVAIIMLFGLFVGYVLGFVS